MSWFVDDVLDSLVDAGSHGGFYVRRVYVGSGQSDSGEHFVLVALLRTDQPDVRVITQFVDEDDASPDNSPGLGLALWEAAAYDTGYRARRGNACLDGSAATVLATLWVDGLPLHEQWGGLRKIFDRADPR